MPLQMCTQYSATSLKMRGKSRLIHPSHVARGIRQTAQLDTCALCIAKSSYSSFLQLSRIRTEYGSSCTTDNQCMSAHPQYINLFKMSVTTPVQHERCSNFAYIRHEREVHTGPSTWYCWIPYRDLSSRTVAASCAVAYVSSARASFVSESRWLERPL